MMPVIPLLGGAILVASFMAALIFAIDAVRERNPDVPLYDDGRPFNLLLHPEKLTNDGQRSRISCFTSLAIFVVTLVALIIFSMLTY